MQQLLKNFTRFGVFLKKNSFVVNAFTKKLEYWQPKKKMMVISSCERV